MHSNLIILAIVPFSFFLSALGSFLIYRFGTYIALVDEPNERSSHSILTPRSGSIGIFLAFIPVGIFFTKYQIFTIFAVIIGLIGLIEDRFTIPAKIRLLFQLIISTITVGLFLGLPTSVIAGALFIFWIVFITGTTNYFNFMDGINGIAVLTGLVGFGLITVFSIFIVNEPDIALMSLVLLTGCLGFLPFNFPRAKVFMGDVGSIFLGFVFAAFVVRLSTSVSIFICTIMFLCMFYADASLTIFYRWQKGENLMNPHRSHLYQYMSNELRIPQWKVSLIYALTQLIFGVLALLAYKNGLSWQFVVFGVFGVMFIIVYKIIKNIKPALSEKIEGFRNNPNTFRTSYK